jgi:hypothetical protein
MNQAHWHLAFNHLPVIGTYFSLLILASGLVLKNSIVKNTGLALFIVTAIFAIPVFLTGEGAEDVLESIGQKNEHFINEHEEIAEKAFWICEIIGALSIVALIGFFKQKQFVQKLIMIIFLSGLANSLLMIKVGNSGGEIRHTEIRTANGNLNTDSKSEEDE